MEGTPAQRPRLEEEVGSREVQGIPAERVEEEEEVEVVEEGVVGEGQAGEESGEGGEGGAAELSPPASPSSKTSASPGLPPTSEAAEFSRRLLTTALGLSPDSSLENLVAFLDSTSCLRSLKMPDIDLASETAVCFFVNVYHSLLQHALLLLGPPTK